jgi:hypothetical protein
MARALVLVALAAIVLAFVTRADAEERRPFVVFDNMLYRGKPDTTTAGLRPASILYEGWIWPRGEPFGVLPERSAFVNILHEHVGQSGPIVLDIERLPLSGSPGEIRGHAQVLVTLADWTRAAAPGRVVGYYGTHTLTHVPPQSLAAARELAAHVDALFPPMYTFDDDREAWAKKAQDEAAEARALGPGKPVYFYLWPQYHDKTPKEFQYLAPDHWRFELETARRLADGVVIWGSGHFDWNDANGWWRVTEDFVRSLPRAR